MAWNSYNPYRLICFYYASVAICAAVVGLRIFANLKGFRKTAWYREVLVLLALLSFATIAGLETMMWKYYWYDDDVEANRFALQGTERVEWVFMIGTIEDFFYLPSIYYIKIELLFLYHQLAPRCHHPKIFILLLVTWFIVVGGFIITWYFAIFACVPFKNNWDLMEVQTTPEFIEYAPHECSQSQNAFLALWISHLISDIWVYGVPIWIIWRIRLMKTAQKWSAIAMFIVGFLSVICATFLVVTSQVVGPDELNPAANRANDFITALQPSCAIILVCMPHMKSVWRYVVTKAKNAKGDSASSSGGSGLDSGKKGSQTSGEHDGSGMTPITTSDQVSKSQMVASVNNV